MGLIEKIASKKLPLVIGEGSKRARLLILGEALGAEEVRLGRPFVGPAGYMLDDLLRRAEVPRGECYVTNVIPTRPPENKIDRLPELGLTLEECQDWIREEIRQIRPNCVLALGVVPLKTLTPYQVISEWRGSILSFDGIKVVPSFHPSWTMQQPDKTAKKERDEESIAVYTYGSAGMSTVLDAKRAWEEAKTRELVLPVRNLIVAPDYDLVMAKIWEFMAHKWLVLDVETRGKWIDCIGFAAESGEGICIPRGVDYWKDEALARAIDNSIRYLLWNHAGLIAQNGPFDMTMLLANELPVRKLAFDTMAAHHFLWPELPHSLAYLTSIYTREPYYKYMIKGERWKYNCLDVTVTMEIAENLMTELEEIGVAKDFYDYVMPLLHISMKMGLRGINVDLEYKDRLQRTLAYLIERRIKKVKKVFNRPDLNPNSNEQLQKLLYEDLGLPKQIKRRSGGKVCVDAEAIEKLVKISGREDLTTILDVRDVQKKKSTYADAKVSADGRLRTSYAVTGTETGRLNSKITLFGEGWNSQNPPRGRWFRKVAIADLEEELLEADLKFAEALLIAWLANDRATIEAVLRGEDIYKWHAGRMFGKAPDQITKEERTLVKPVILGCGYGLGPDHLAQMLGVSRSRGQDYRKLFFDSCPAILEYQEKIRETLDKTRTLVTPFNRRRVFLGRKNEDLYRKGFAYLPQSSCVDYMNRGIVRMDGLIPAKLMLQVHDAVVMSRHPRYAERVQRMIVEALAEPIWINGQPLVIPVELKVGTNWGELETIGVFNLPGGKNA